jgi:hypothetical protein
MKLTIFAQVWLTSNPGQSCGSARNRSSNVQTLTDRDRVSMPEVSGCEVGTSEGLSFQVVEDVHQSLDIIRY